MYLRAADLPPYLRHVDVAFAFELLQSDFSPAALRAAIEGALALEGPQGRLAWVLSNHDFPRLPDRVGADAVRAAAMLILTLPGVVFLYQGDELGMADGPGADPPVDRYGRDAHRHPMVWDDDAPNGGFSTGTPWLPAVDVPGGGVRQQRGTEDSVLALYRDLIAARRTLAGAVEFLDLGDGRARLPPRDGHAVAINMGASRSRGLAAGDRRALPPTPAGYPSGTQVTDVTLGPGEGLLVER